MSLGAQVDVLVGSRGLLPAGPWAASVRAAGKSFADEPSVFVAIGASDGALHAGIAVGIALAVLALAGVAPGICFGLSTLLYLSYAVVGRTFFGFQWDNLLLECGLLPVLLPRDRRAPWAHFLLRVLLFKLYFESGVAKWQSPRARATGRTAAAMTFYYEQDRAPAGAPRVVRALAPRRRGTTSRAGSRSSSKAPRPLRHLLRAAAGCGARYRRCGVFTLFQAVKRRHGELRLLLLPRRLALHVLLLDERGTW